jgi:cytochrome c oxidase subunit 1
VTGLKLHRQAELLIKANAVAATVALLIGGISAILILLTRWQAVHLLDATMFYRVLTAHGLTMLIFFIIFFEMAVLYFAAGPLLNSRIAAPKLGWFNFGLMTLGATLCELMIWTGKADVLMTSYIPLRADPLYYLGIIFFAVGALLVCFQLVATLRIAKRERT